MMREAQTYDLHMRNAILRIRCEDNFTYEILE